MKNKFLKIVSLVTVVVAIAFTTPAQNSIGNLVRITNAPAILATGATTNLPTQLIPVPRVGDMALSSTFNVSGTGTSSVVISGAFTVDGTNFLPSFTLIGTAFGVTNQTIGTNWSQAQLAGYTYLNITVQTNGNAGTLTNKAFYVGRKFYNQ